MPLSKEEQAELETTVQTFEDMRGRSIELAERIDYLRAKAAVTHECIACNPNSEFLAHEAYVEVWQAGGNWVPSCCDRVLDWWNTDSTQAIKERKEAGAPEAWIRPLQ